MIEARKYHKGLEEAIILTMRNSGKHPTPQQIVKGYYENLKLDWVQIQIDKNEAEVLQKLRLELRDGIVKFWAEFWNKTSEQSTTILSMLTEGKPQTDKEYTCPILKQ